MHDFALLESMTAATYPLTAVQYGMLVDGLRIATGSVCPATGLHAP